ncbi:hypothetical protein B9Z44_09725 [Limnohabitans curvus]|uniref:FkbM family methyltransferase n=1 Tax=Limnohabitans curvus TaxID=323423 RepID=A0A315ERF4_9BURK|nr:FkbM family methyltransferase [Limnohabitans curvus]PUE59831.1 hypothetical protein B9Z44_09725 [Limnohabitans curvus]
MLPRVNNIRTETGEFLLFSTEDYISRHLYAKGSWDPHLLTISRLIYKKLSTPVILDIGANLGAYSVPVAREIMETGGQIYAFEPQRIVYYQLCGNVVLNRLDNVFTYNVALGSTERQIEIPALDFEQSDNV